MRLIGTAVTMCFRRERELLVSATDDELAGGRAI
jgi:hypothetical protein